MNKDISFKAIKIKPLLNKLYKKYGRHAAFGCMLLVLLVYLLVVVRISSLANAEPAPDQQDTTTPIMIPTVDKKIISQIQTFEDNNTDIHALFQQARNNPFQE